VSVLYLENVSKKIGKKTIISQLQMRVNRGEVYGFLGPNGAGKTTTIRMIVGLIKPTSGTIRICGHDILQHRSEALAQIGCIVENPETYSYLSGKQNLLHYARLAGIKQIEQRIKEVTEIVKLGKRVEDKVKTYSLGMRQRLGVAQALLSNPKLLVLDEPTNGLDPEGIREFRDLMRELAQSGMAVFVSSHMLNEVEQLCDRIGIIQHGRMVTEQKMEDLLKETEQQHILLRVTDPKRVANILRRERVPIKRIDEESLEIELEKEKYIPQLVRFLVAHKVDVYAVEPIKASLEDQFLELIRNADQQKGGEQGA
jgi:ABC-2 type transport system ATP-binding protein